MNSEQILKLVEAANKAYEAERPPENHDLVDSGPGIKYGNAK